jgi:uncharacterized protein YdhG (YjbR/CyaY superfamily)
VAEPARSRGGPGERSPRVDEYIAALPPVPRRALEELRKAIRAAAPDAVETIAYGMPAFRQDGRFLVSYAAYRDHCSLFPASPGARGVLGDRLERYLSGKGTLRFHRDDPIPSSWSSGSSGPGWRRSPDRPVAEPVGAGPAPSGAPGVGPGSDCPEADQEGGRGRSQPANNRCMVGIST